MRDVGKEETWARTISAASCEWQAPNCTPYSREQTEATREGATIASARGFTPVG